MGNNNTKNADINKFVFCTSCGKKLSNDVKFCPYCGNPVPHKSKDKNFHKRSILALSAVLLVMVLALGGMGIASWKNNHADKETREYYGMESTVNSWQAEDEDDVKEKEAQEYYEMGRTKLYGLDGSEADLEAAYDCFTKAEELGYADAAFYLGVLLDRYNYPSHDFETARQYYEDCGEKGRALVALGCLYLNRLYLNEQGVEEDRDKARELFQEAIDGGYVEGYYGIGVLERVEGNYTDAMENFEKALESTEELYVSSAMYYIGYMYMNGEGVEEDDGKAMEQYEKIMERNEKAMEWYEKAADLGNSSAMCYIGYMYMNGWVVEQDDGKAMEQYEKAMEWYEKAADLGNSSAMYYIGFMYEREWGVEQDYGKAMEWYEKAADLGNPSAMYNVGCMYESGEGVEQDYGAALEWYEKAAGLGEPFAMCSIGYMYESGLGVEQDYGKAMEWYEKAADLGISSAMLCIGYMYEHGEGVETDYEEALMWYKKAVDLGGGEAAVDALRDLQAKMQ